MKITVKQNSTTWESEASSIEQIMSIIIENPYNAEVNTFTITQDEALVFSGKIMLECNEDEESDFWFDVEESQAETKSEIEEAIESFFE